MPVIVPRRPVITPYRRVTISSRTAPPGHQRNTAAKPHEYNGYPDGERGVMGRHQRAETLGLISFLICAMVGAIMMSLYMQFAPAIWQITQRRFMVCAGILAGCAALSFCVGYASHSHLLNLQRGWFAPIRRVFEILALSIVYAATVFLSSFALLGAINGMMGSATFSGYLTPICAGFAGVVGYMTFVQAEMMNAKTLASLLPFFVISGVCTAGLTTDDPYWYHNNFSQLGDRTTFAARMFNSTLMLAGTCIIIVSYFAISELITTKRIQRARHQMNKSTGTAADDRDITHFTLRIAILSLLLTISGLMFIGIGAFRYTPHPIMHNVCANHAQRVRQGTDGHHGRVDALPAVARPADTEGDVGDFRLGDSDLLCHRYQDADGPGNAHQSRSARRTAVSGMVHRLLKANRRNRGRSSARSADDAADRHW